uniref:Uncharacterized protein n=1 Tax=Ciona intestinalis TaxID=7719 RepID=F6THU3_CIOIN
PFTVLAICVAMLVRWWRRPHGLPPGPRGIPLLGVIPFMGEFPERVIKKWSLEKYGPIMCARMGMEDGVFLNTAEAIKMAFCDKSEHLSGRPRTTIFKQVTKDKGLALKQYGKDYNIIRKFVVRTLSQWGVGKTMIEDQIVEEAGLLADFLKNKTNQPIELKLYFYVMTSNIIGRVVCGRRHDFEDEEYHEILNNIQKMFSPQLPLSFWLFPRDSTPLIFCWGLKHLPWFRGANNRMIERVKKTLEYCKGVIEEHKKTFDKNNLRDLIDALLYEQQFGKKSKRKVLLEDELVVIVRDLFTAGSETSSLMISWVLIMLLHHPEHAKKVIEEIDDVMGPNGAPSTKHRDRMPFTCAVIQETFRCKIVAPIGIQHYAQATVELGGYIIPQGTMVYSNIWGVHNDPVAWPNPSKFDPYRHISKDGKFFTSNNIISFSTGPRSCPGEPLAKMEIFLFVTKILQKFEVKAPPDKLPSLVGVNCLLFSPESCELIFIPM